MTENLSKEIHKAVYKVYKTGNLKSNSAFFDVLKYLRMENSRWNYLTKADLMQFENPVYPFIL